MVSNYPALSTMYQLSTDQCITDDYSLVLCLLLPLFVHYVGESAVEDVVTQQQACINLDIFLISGRHPGIRFLKIALNLVLDF